MLLDRGQSGVYNRTEHKIIMMSLVKGLKYQWGKNNKRQGGEMYPCPFKSFTGVSALGITIGVVIQKNSKCQSAGGGAYN